MDELESTMMVRPTIIVVPIPQATDTIEVASTEVYSYFVAFALLKFASNQY